MKSILSISALCLLTLFTACKKEKEPTPQEMLQGQWVIQSQELLGTVTAGDGSYLQFDACSSSCSGVDYKASDGTTGSISYTLNEDATILSITDNSSDGGSWNAEWDVLELTETDLRITASTFLGNLKVEMTK